MRGYVDVSPETRSRMRRVRRRHTAPEIAVRKVLHSMGYRFRLHRQDLPGKPDIVFPSRKKVIMVHGCFWHGHLQCRRAKLPTKNAETWGRKIKENQARDNRNEAVLKELGWRVMVVWECETRDLTTLANRLVLFLSNT